MRLVRALLKLLFSVSVAGIAGVAGAQTPLTIEQLIVDSRRLQLLSAADYRSSEPAPGVALRGGGVGIALRYGLRPNWELNAGWRRETWSRYLPGLSDGGERRQLSLGSTWQLRREGRFPAAVLGLSGWQGGQGADVKDRGAELLLTLYQSLDPVVLSLQLAVGRSEAERASNWTSSEHWRVQPQLNFAVNPRVTLLGGFSFSRRDISTEGSLLRKREMLALRSGIAVAASAHDTLFLIGDVASADSGLSLQIQWFHQF